MATGVRPTGVQGTHIPCIHRTADGIFRGAYIGIVWGAFFAREHLQETARSAGGTGSYPACAARAGRFMGAHILGFSLFLGGYNALQCSLEQVCGQDSGLTPIIAGGTLGMLASGILPTRPTLPGIAVGSGATALTCYFISRVLLPPPSRTRAGAEPPAVERRSAAAPPSRALGLEEGAF